MASLVALRKESVDRNLSMGLDGRFKLVALRKESVDRNLYYGDDLAFSDGSLSARRAWIEIVTRYKPTPKPVVALRKESVDRNSSGAKADSVSNVALRKESVDRNQFRC